MHAPTRITGMGLPDWWVCVGGRGAHPDHAPPPLTGILAWRDAPLVIAATGVISMVGEEKPGTDNFPTYSVSPFTIIKTAPARDEQQEQALQHFRRHMHHTACPHLAAHNACYY